MEQNQASEEQDISFKAQIPSSTYQETFPNVGMRSGCSFKKNQPSPIANANGMVFSSYLEKNYDRNCQSSPDAYNLRISQNYGKLPVCTTPSSAHFSHTPTHHSPHCVPKPLQHCSSHASMWRMHSTPQQPCNYLPHHKTYVPHHLEASHAWPLKNYSAPSHCSHFWPWHSPC